MIMLVLRQIISGGQTGADKTALVVAKELGFETGGWAPRNYRTEAGSDWSLREYGLKETHTDEYRLRTRMNVKEADGTVWFGHVTSPGFKCTYRAVQDYRKHFLSNPTSYDLWKWLQHTQCVILNVAGNRESTNPHIVETVRTILGRALREEK